MNPLTEARQHLTKVCEAEGYTVYPSPPESLATPSVFFQPDDPWVEPVTLGSSKVNMTANVNVTANGTNESAQADVEERLWSLMARLREASIQVGSVTAPVYLNEGNLNAASVAIEVSVYVTD